MNQTLNESIKELNTFIFEQNKPVVIFITCVMLFGIVGNSLALYVYLLRMKSSTLNILIIHMGFIDMIGCCLFMPLSLVKLILPVMYPSNFLCKLHPLISYYCWVGSVFSVLVIAAERFNRVCRPLASQAAPLHAKRIVSGVSLVSFLVALPFYPATTRKEMFENDIVGHTCVLVFSLSLVVYILILLLLFCICLLIIFILYFLIWRNVRQYFRELEARKHKQPNDESENSTQTRNESIHNSSKVNMTIFSITALLVITFTPYLIVFLVTLIGGTYSRTVTQFTKGLWLLNYSLGPVVYGICNGEFRQEIKRLFSKETIKKSSNNETKDCELAARNPERTELTTE